MTRPRFFVPVLIASGALLAAACKREQPAIPGASPTPAGTTAAETGAAAPEASAGAAMPSRDDVLARAGAALAISGETATAGPWDREGTRWWAVTIWPLNATTAGLALVAATPDGVRVEARGTVAAGGSQRYDESYAPVLGAEPVDVPGRPPAPVVIAQSMGHGGGGGAVRTVMLPEQGGFRPVMAVILEEFTNVNTMVESDASKPCEETWMRSRVEAGRAVVDVRSCLDGTMQTERWAFDGKTFVRGPGD